MTAAPRRLDPSDPTAVAAVEGMCAALGYDLRRVLTPGTWQVLADPDGAEVWLSAAGLRAVGLLADDPRRVELAEAIIRSSRRWPARTPRPNFCPALLNHAHTGALIMSTPKVKVTEVGRVVLGEDDAVVVTTVARTWPPNPNEFAQRSGAATVAPLGVEVRRHPSAGDLVGGLTPPLARALAALITQAADQAETAPPDDGEPPLASSRRRAR